MEKYRMPLWVPLAILFGIGLAAFVLPAWTDAIVALGQSGIDEGWSGFAGVLIGSVLTSVVAGIAVYFGYLGIREQIRVSVLTREEDRLMRELPGLRDARELLEDVLGRFKPSRSVHGIVNDFQKLGIDRPGSTIGKDIKALLPDTDDGTRVQIRRAIHDASRLGTDAESSENSADYFETNANVGSVMTPDEFKSKLDKMRRDAHASRALFDMSIQRIDLLKREVAERIELYETRLPKIRRAVSEYFDK
jgi:hypothetical protein